MPSLIIIPAKRLGGTDNAGRFGWPAVDALVLFEGNWSSEDSLTYSHWLAGLVLRGGWSGRVPLTTFCLPGFTGGDRNKWKLFASSSAKCREVSRHHSES
jgi:hypothetical protein